MHPGSEMPFRNKNKWAIEIGKSMKEPEMQLLKWKETNLKRLGSIKFEMAFWKRQNQGDSKIVMMLGAMGVAE